MKQKHLEIFQSLYNIFGLGKKTINTFYFFAGLNTKTCPKHIKKRQEKKIFKQVNKNFLGKPLKKFILDRIKFYFEIRSWKGIRQHKKYPIRGQRVQVNSKKN